MYKSLTDMVDDDAMPMMDLSQYFRLGKNIICSFKEISIYLDLDWIQNWSRLDSGLTWIEPRLDPDWRFLSGIQQ